MSEIDVSYCEEVVLEQVHSNSYRAFDSVNHPPLATLGVEVDWNVPQMLQACFLSAAQSGGSSGIPAECCVAARSLLDTALCSVSCLNNLQALALPFYLDC